MPAFTPCAEGPTPDRGASRGTWNLASTARGDAGTSSAAPPPRSPHLHAHGLHLCQLWLLCLDLVAQIAAATCLTRASARGGAARARLPLRRGRLHGPPLDRDVLHRTVHRHTPRTLGTAASVADMSRPPRPQLYCYPGHPRRTSSPTSGTSPPLSPRARPRASSVEPPAGTLQASALSLPPSLGLHALARARAQRPLPSTRHAGPCISRAAPRPKPRPSLNQPFIHAYKTPEAHLPCREGGCQGSPGPPPARRPAPRRRPPPRPPPSRSRLPARQPPCLRAIATHMQGRACSWKRCLSTWQALQAKERACSSVGQPGPAPGACSRPHCTRICRKEDAHSLWGGCRLLAGKATCTEGRTARAPAPHGSLTQQSSCE
jgi:hypothetical protein